MNTKRSGVHVALLRGVNVGGKNKISMKDLAAMFAEAGASDVTTYIQSGNVVFRAAPAVARRLPAALAEVSLERLGFGLSMVIRTAAELSAAARANPFIERGEDEEKLHVVFLQDRPSAAKVAALDPRRSPPDELAVAGREIYLFCPNGLGRTKLTNAYFDSKLETVSTIRSWRTVEKLIELAEA